MKIAVCIIFALIAFAGIVSGQGAIDYYPLGIGYYWIEETDTVFGTYEPSTFTVTIEGTDSILGEAYFRQKQRLKADNNSFDYIWYTWAREDSSGIVTGASGEIPNIDSASIIDPPVHFLPNGIVNLGYSWNFYCPELGGYWDCIVESVSETVVVPAGTFTDCIKIKTVITDSLGVDTNQVTDFYYARYVGEVEKIGWSSFLLDFEFELREYYVGVCENRQKKNSVRFSLKQNMPNPFSSSTHIRYQISKANYVSLNVYDITGREIANPVNGFRKEGEYSVTWDATENSIGIYFYRLTSGGFSETKRCIIVK
jgi:hypothetical protein